MHYFGWSFSDIDGFEREIAAKNIEGFYLENEGQVGLYGKTQLTREQFYQMFDPHVTKYDAIRKRYDCEKAFPHVYEKISKLGRDWIFIHYLLALYNYMSSQMWVSTKHNLKWKIALKLKLVDVGNKN